LNPIPRFRMGNPGTSNQMSERDRLNKRKSERRDAQRWGEKIRLFFFKQIMLYKREKWG